MAKTSNQLSILTKKKISEGKRGEVRGNQRGCEQESRRSRELGKTLFSVPGNTTLSGGAQGGKHRRKRERLINGAGKKQNPYHLSMDNGVIDLKSHPTVYLVVKSGAACVRVGS